VHVSSSHNISCMYLLICNEQIDNSYIICYLCCTDTVTLKWTQHTDTWQILKTHTTRMPDTFRTQHGSMIGVSVLHCMLHIRYINPWQNIYVCKFAVTGHMSISCDMHEVIKTVRHTYDPELDSISQTRYWLVRSNSYFSLSGFWFRS